MPAPAAAAQPQVLNLSIDGNHIDSISIPITQLKTINLLIQSPEDDCLPKVLEWLIKYAETGAKYRIQLLSAGIVPSLLQRSRLKDANIRKQVIACIAAVTEISEPHPAMDDPALMDRLLELIHSAEEPVEVQEEATFALASLSRDPVRRAKIREAGSIKVFHRLLASPDPDTRKSAEIALLSMLDESQSRLEFKAINGVSSLLDLLTAEYTEITENALLCLLKMADDASTRSEIKKKQGFKRVLGTLSHKNVPVLLASLKCIYSCLDDGEIAATIADANGIAPIIQLLGNPDPKAPPVDAKIKQTVFLTVAKIAKIEKFHGNIRECGFLGHVILATNSLATALFSNASVQAVDTVLLANSLMALATFGLNEINHADLLKANIFEVLLKLLNQDVGDVRRNSLIAILKFVKRAILFKDKFRTTEGCKQLVGLLFNIKGESRTVNWLEQALDLLNYLVEDAILRPEVLKLEGLKLLSSLITVDRWQSQILVCTALATLFDEEANRLVFAQTLGGLKLLLPLVKSPCDELCRQACWTLNCLCATASIALEARKLGLIEILIDIQRDQKRPISKFASSALDCLLCYHLSAKYWLRNVLHEKDIIGDGFYDCGSAGLHLNATATAETALPSLDAFRRQEVNSKREIIEVDRVADERLRSLIQSVLEEAKTILLQSLPNTRVELLRMIAKAVNKRFGGEVLPGSPGLNTKLHVSELKLKLKNNVIPLGAIELGAFYHRALAFKILADEVFNRSTSSIPCDIRLERGDYGRAWNTVHLRPNETGRPGDTMEGEFVVDLMHFPGQLLPIGSPEANRYQHLQ